MPSAGATLGVPGQTIDQLIGSLPYAQTALQPDMTKAQKVFGAVGDALMAAAQARAGGVPNSLGPFAAELKKREAEKLAATNQERAIRAKEERDIRVGQFKDVQDFEQAKELERIKAQNKMDVASLKGIRLVKQASDEMINGKTTTVVRFFHPTTGQLIGVYTGGEKGYAPAIVPGLEIDTETGETRASLLRVPRTGGPATPVQGQEGKRVEPQMPPGMATDIATGEGIITRFPSVRDAYAKAEKESGGRGNILERAWRQVQAAAAKHESTQFIADPALTRYYAKMKSILFPLVKKGSGVAFSAKELDKWEGRFPIPGVHDADTADYMWDALIDEMIQDIQAKYDVTGRTNTNPHALSNKPATGQVHRASDFLALPEEVRQREMERFKAEGGTIIPDDAPLPTPGGGRR